MKIESLLLCLGLVTLSLLILLFVVYSFIIFIWLFRILINSFYCWFVFLRHDYYDTGKQNIIKKDWKEKPLWRIRLLLLLIKTIPKHLGGVLELKGGAEIDFRNLIPKSRGFHKQDDRR